MATRKKSHENGKKHKERSKGESQNLGLYKEVLVVGSGKEITGEIKATEEGQQCLEGDLNAPQWKNPRNLAVEIGGLTIRLNDLPSDCIKYAYRYRPIGPGLLVAEMVVLVKEAVSIGVGKTKSAINRFIQKTIVKPDSSTSGGEDQEGISENDIQLVDESVAGFLLAHGGKPMPSDLQVSMEGEVLAKLSGIWKNPESDENSKDEQIKIRGFYDGRRLRQRFFTVVEESKKGSTLDVYYDDNEFDQELRELMENKNALLQLKCKKKKIGRKTRLHLDEMEVVGESNSP